MKPPAAMAAQEPVLRFGVAAMAPTAPRGAERLAMDTDDEIGRRAYAIWEREGRPHGREREHWNQAEKELQAERQGDPAGVIGAELRRWCEVVLKAERVAG